MENSDVEETEAVSLGKSETNEWRGAVWKRWAEVLKQRWMGSKSDTREEK